MLTKQIQAIDKLNKNRRGVTCIIRKPGSNEYEYAFLESPPGLSFLTVCERIKKSRRK